MTRRSVRCALACLTTAALVLMGGRAALADDLDGTDDSVSVLGAAVRARQEASRVDEELSRLLDEARRDQDITRVTCRNDKLTQLRALSRMLDQRLGEWVDALSAHDQVALEHHGAVLQTLGQRVAVLEQEATGCIGQDVFETGVTRVETTIDPGPDYSISSGLLPTLANSPPLARNAQQQPAPPPTAPPLPGADSPNGNQLLVYRASFTLAVFESEATLDRIAGLARELGGHVQERAGREITIRVPAPRFDEAVEQIGEAGDVLAQHVQASDVSETHRDLAIRLRNATAMRERLEALLSQAQSVEDALRVERELERVTLQIEQLTAQLRDLDDRIALSTITVELRARPREGTVGDDDFRLPFGWLDELGLGTLMDLSGRAPSAQPAPPSYTDDYDEFGEY